MSHNLQTETLKVVREVRDGLKEHRETGNGAARKSRREKVKEQAIPVIGDRTVAGVLIFIANA